MNSHILNVWLTRRYKNVSCFPLVNEVEGRQRRFASFRFYEDKGVNVSKKNTEGHSGELNDIHQRHDREKETKDDSKPQNKGVTWSDIVRRETMFESIKNNSH